MYNRFISFFIIIIGLFFAGSPTALKAQEISPLSTPRKTVYTFTYWQQEENLNLQMAATTMKLANKPIEERIELSEKLLQLFDAHGFLINFDKIPDEENYVDSLSGMHRYSIFSKLPKVYLVKEGEEWLFSEETIQKIPELYSATFSYTVESFLSKMPKWASKEWFGIQIWQFIAIFLWILFGFILKRLFEFIFENFLRRIVEKTDSNWDDELLDGVEKPISYIFLFLFLLSTYTNLRFSVKVNALTSFLLELAVSLSFVWLFYNLSNVFTKYLAKLAERTETEIDDQIIVLIRKTLKVFVIFMGFVIILQNNGVNVTALIGGLGLGGLAVALAAKDTLENFFGSLTILWDKPFKVGDWIKVGDIEGTVIEIGFRSTRVRTFYTSLITVPNSKIATAEIDNYQQRTYRRYITYFDLKYDTDPDALVAFIEGVKGIVKSNKYFRQDYYVVQLSELGSTSLKVMAYVFFNVQDYNAEMLQRHNFLLQVLRLAKSLGVEIAYPTQTVRIEGQNVSDKVDDKKLSREELAARLIEFGPGGKQTMPEGFKIIKDGKEIDFGSDA